MIELAPNRKQGLALANPLMAAPGAVGFGGEAGGLIELERFGGGVALGVGTHFMITETTPDSGGGAQLR